MATTPTVQNPDHDSQPGHLPVVLQPAGVPGLQTMDAPGSVPSDGALAGDATSAASHAGPVWRSAGDDDVTRDEDDEEDDDEDDEDEDDDDDTDEDDEADDAAVDEDAAGTDDEDIVAEMPGSSKRPTS